MPQLAVTFNFKKVNPTKDAKKYDSTGRIPLVKAIAEDFDLEKFRSVLAKKPELEFNDGIYGTALDHLFYTASNRYGTEARGTIFIMLEELLEAGAKPQLSDNTFFYISRNAFFASNPGNLGASVKPETLEVVEFYYDCFALFSAYGGKINWPKLLEANFGNETNNESIKAEMSAKIVTAYNAMTGSDILLLEDIGADARLTDDLEDWVGVGGKPGRKLSIDSM